MKNIVKLFFGTLFVYLFLGLFANANAQFAVNLSIDTPVIKMNLDETLSLSFKVSTNQPLQGKGSLTLAYVMVPSGTDVSQHGYFSDNIYGTTSNANFNQTYSFDITKLVSEFKPNTPYDFYGYARWNSIDSEYSSGYGLSNKITYQKPLADLRMNSFSLGELNKLSGKPRIVFDISNIGSVTVNKPFNNIYLEQASEYDGKGTIKNLKTTGKNYYSLINPNKLKPNEAQGVAFNAFDFEGTAGQAVSLRVCIDRTSSSDLVGVVAESNENNNCSNWVNTKITLGPRPYLASDYKGGSIGYNPELRWKSDLVHPTITPWPITSCKATVYDWPRSEYSTPIVVGSWFGEKSISKMITVNGVPDYEIFYEKIGPINKPDDYVFRITCINADGEGSDIVEKITVCEEDEIWDSTTNKCQILIEDGLLPNLKAENPIPTSTIVETNTEFKSIIKNEGTVPTGPIGSSFHNLLQVCSVASESNACPTTIKDVTATMGVINAGKSNTATLTYKFDKVGTYGVRVCADKSKTSTNQTSDEVNESEEEDNCSGWVDVNVGDIASSNIIPWIGASPNPVDFNGKTTLTWKLTSGAPLYCNLSASNSSGISDMGDKLVKLESSTFLTSILKKETTFKIDCGPNLENKASVTVTVNPLKNKTDEE